MSYPFLYASALEQYGVDVKRNFFLKSISIQCLALYSEWSGLIGTPGICIVKVENIPY